MELSDCGRRSVDARSVRINHAIGLNKSAARKTQQIMVNIYKAEREEQEFFALQRTMTRRTRKAGVLTEEDVERIVFEDR
jgi:hypothetical protein